MNCRRKHELVRNKSKLNSTEKEKKGKGKQTDNGELSTVRYATYFQHNISKFYYCYDYVRSFLQRYIFPNFYLCSLLFLILSAVLVVLFIIPYCVEKLKHKFRWKCFCSQDSAIDVQAFVSALLLFSSLPPSLS